ncbi:MAG: extracellular solute-binding protein [Butyrivibrio sp.]|nr:extracellular solute-binding protein [Butyrivibrio sp.]
MIRKIGKRIIFNLAVISLVMGCTACANNDDYYAGMYDGDVNAITCMVWDRGTFPEGKTADDNTLANWIKAQVKEELGIAVSFVSIPRETSDAELEKMVEKGTAPDIIFTYSSGVFGSLTKRGRVAEIDEAYETYGNNIKANIGEIQYMGMYNDKRVAVMKRRGFQSPRHLAYIRKDWCEALGIDIPKTKEELFEYLYAVKEKNPGNVDKVVPWAMGGNVYSERFYQNMICSYVPKLSERDSYIYSEKFMFLAKGAIDGVRKMNELYNDGIISLDFVADVDNSKFKKDIVNGNAGFFIDDCTNPFSYIAELKENVPTAELVPLQCFETETGEYRNITEPLYGMYIMVPAYSKEKLPSIMKYLNWLADPEIAEVVNFTPDHEDTDQGAPMALSENELKAKGYPLNPDDYCIVNGHFHFVDEKEKQVSTLTSAWTFEDKAWFDNFYDICVTNQFVYPATSTVLESEALYQEDLEHLIVQSVYNLIGCPTVDFDNEWVYAYDQLKEHGLEEVLNERAGYYDSREIRLGE